MRWPWQRPQVASVQPQAPISPSGRLSTKQPWQDRARFFARALGLVSFAQETASMGGARVEWLVQQRQADGEWVTVDDESLTGVLSWYRNDYQSARELIQQHLYRIGVDGERWEIMFDRADGSVGFYVVPTPAVQWRGVSEAQVSLAPAANIADGSMLVVPSEKIHRLWVPGKDYPWLAWSPMEGVLEDCERYWSLVKYVRKVANSRMAMGGVLWTPAEAHEERMPDVMIGGRSIKNPQSVLDAQMQQAAKESLERDDTIAGVLPFSLRYANALNPPRFVDMSKGLSSDVLAAMENAAEAVAVGLPMPASMILGKSENHWNEWLMDERSFRWAVAPNVERVAWDLTASYLRPTLRVLYAMGSFNGDPEGFRVWYDPTPALIHPDQTPHALDLNAAGLLANVPTLEAYGFTEEDLMDPVERSDLLKFIQAKNLRERVNETSAPAIGPSVPSGAGVVAGPPPVPAMTGAGLPNPITAEIEAWYSRR